MLRRTEAIVLKTIPFSEADLIVTSLTLDYGLLKTFAKSPRKTKSRFGSSLEPLTYSRISFWGREDANLPRLTQSDIIRPFQSIRDSLASFLKVSEIIEITLKLLPEREPNSAIFHLLSGILGRTEEGFRGRHGEEMKMKDLLERLVISYKIKLLDMLGYGPALRGCARCGRSGHDFFISHGSVLCGLCAQATDASVKLSPGMVKLYTILRKWETAKIDRIKPSAALLSELSGLLDAHLRQVMHGFLKT